MEEEKKKFSCMDFVFKRHMKAMERVEEDSVRDPSSESSKPEER